MRSSLLARFVACAGAACTRRGWRRFVVPGVLALSALACALDEGGLLPGDSGTDAIIESGPPDVLVESGPPPSCSTLDATACVDAAIPDGWSFVGVALMATTCPGAPGDYTRKDYVTDVALDVDAGACKCGCVPSGSYTCAGQIATASHNNSCDTSGTFDGGDVVGCFVPVAASKNLLVGPLPSPKALNAACDASAAPPSWRATNVTACGPSCTADYCGLNGSFHRCVASTTSVVCPPPFAPAGQIGVEAGVTASCAGCSCTVPPPTPCSATVTAFGGSGCTQSLGTVMPDGICHLASTSVDVASFQYAPIVPAVTCNANVSGTSTVTLGGPLTVCCLQ